MQDFLEQEQRKSGKGGAGEGLFGSAIQQSLVTQKVVTSEFMVKKSASTYWALCLTAWSGVVVQLCATEHVSSYLHRKSDNLSSLHALAAPDESGSTTRLVQPWNVYYHCKGRGTSAHCPQSLAVLCPLC